MSTNQPLSKISLGVIFISGAYLFFITLVLAPYINFTVFSSFHATAKVLYLTLAGVIAAFQLLFVLPYIKRRSIQNMGVLTRYGIYVSLFGTTLSVLLSASMKTSLFGMFTSWESNVMIFIIYSLLFLAWYTYFLVLKLFGLNKTVFHTLMALCIVVAIIYSLGEYYIWKPNTGYISQSVSRISLGFRNPLYAAYFLGILWSYSFAYVSESLNEGKRTVQNILMVVINVLLYIGITFSLILTFTRSALLAAAAGAVIFILLNLLNNVRNKIGVARTFVISMLLIAIAFTIGYGYRKEFSLRNSDLATESQNTLSTIATSLGKTTEEVGMDFYQNVSQYTSSQIRLLEWKWGLQTWAGSIKNFLFGTGPDTGFFEMPKYRNEIFNNFPTDSSTKPFYVRSLYINTLMQFGIVTISGLLLLLFSLRKSFMNNVSRDWSVFALILGFFAQGIFYYPTQLTVVLFLFGLAYSITTTQNREDEFIVRKPNLLEKIVLLLSVLGLVLWIVPIAKATYIINTYTQSPLPDKVETMSKNSTLLINNNVLKRYLVYHYPEDEKSVSLLPLLSKSNDIDDLRIAADAYYIVARRTNSQSATLSSISVLEKLLSIDATLPATWDGLGLRHLFTGNFEKARDAFTKALSLKPDYWYAYMHMGEVSRQQCIPKEALDWYAKAEQYIPTAENEILEATQEMKEPRTECK